MNNPRRKPRLFGSQLESLEARSMLAGHGFAAAFGPWGQRFDAPADGSIAPAFSAASFGAFSRGPGAGLFRFAAQANGRGALSVQLGDDTGLAATVSYSTRTEDGATERHLKIKVSGAEADSTLDVLVDDVLVGTVATDADGNGSLILSSDPDDDEQQLPADLGIAAGTTVSVGSLSGALAATTPRHLCGGGGNSDATTTRLRAALADSENETATGTAVLKTRTENETEGDETTALTTTTLAVRVTAAAASSTLDVTVGEVFVGQVTTDENGDAKVVFSTNPTGDQVAFINVPTDVTANTAVTVGTLSGKLETAEGHHGRFGHRRWR